jgi:hypothetical protein
MDEIISGRDYLLHAPTQVTVQNKHTGLWYNATNEVHNFMEHRKKLYLKFIYMIWLSRPSSEMAC